MVFLDKLDRLEQDLILCQKGILSIEDILEIHGNKTDRKTIEKYINYLNYIEIITDIMMIKKTRCNKVWMKPLENFEKHLTLAYENNKNITLKRIKDMKIIILDEMRLIYKTCKNKYEILSIDYFVKI